MKFHTDKATLTQYLAIVSKAIPSRPAGHPILSNVLIDAIDDQVTLTGYDLSTGIRVGFDVDVVESGITTVPAKSFGDIVSKLPDGDLMVSLEDDQLAIKASCGTYQFATLPASEYPELPTVSGDSVVLPAAVLINGCNATAASASVDPTKQILQGIQLKTDGSKMTMATTDGHRLAVFTNPVETTNPFELTVPAHALLGFSKVVDPSAEVSLAFDTGQLLVQWNKTLFTSRVLDGQYPNWPQLVPATFDSLVTVDRANMVAALSRLKVIGGSNPVVKVEIEAESLRLSVDAKELGLGQETLPCNAGDPTVSEVCFNVDYLLQGLRVMNSETVAFKLNTATSPVVLEPETYDFFYLVMPVQIRT